MTRDPGERQRRRRERSQRAVAAVAAHAREQGLRVEEPAVLADLHAVLRSIRASCRC